MTATFAAVPRLSGVLLLLALSLCALPAPTVLALMPALQLQSSSSSRSSSSTGTAAPAPSIVSVWGCYSGPVASSTYNCTAGSSAFITVSHVAPSRDVSLRFTDALGLTLTPSTVEYVDASGAVRFSAPGVPIDRVGVRFFPTLTIGGVRLSSNASFFTAYPRPTVSSLSGCGYGGAMAPLNTFNCVPGSMSPPTPTAPHRSGHSASAHYTDSSRDHCAVLCSLTVNGAYFPSADPSPAPSVLVAEVRLPAEASADVVAAVLRCV